MSGWRWDDDFSGDARVVDPRDPDPSGERPRVGQGQIRPRAGAPSEYEPIELYKLTEADVFNLIAARAGDGVAPYRYLDVTRGDGQIIGSRDVRTAGWAVLYLYGVIYEDRRPLVWIDRARAKMRELADFILSYQLGSEHLDSGILALVGYSETTDTEYGGFITVNSGQAVSIADVYSEDVGVCGLALLRAFQTLGDEKYRTGYRAAVKCLRRMQSGGKFTYRHAAQSSAGGRLNTGMWAHKLQIQDLSASAASGYSCTGTSGGGGGAALLSVFHNWPPHIGRQGVAPGGLGPLEAGSLGPFRVQANFSELAGRTVTVRFACIAALTNVLTQVRLKIAAMPTWNDSFTVIDRTGFDVTSTTRAAYSTSATFNVSSGYEIFTLYYEILTPATWSGLHDCRLEACKFFFEIL